MKETKMRKRFWGISLLVALLLGLPRVVFADTYRPVVTVLPFFGQGSAKELKELRVQVVEILDADPRLQVFSPDIFTKTATKYGYTADDIANGDGVNIVARDTQFDGILVGRVRKIGAKFEVSLKVYDGGTGLGLLTTSFSLPRLALRQGEREQIASEIATALAEARLVIPETPEEPPVKPPAKPSNTSPSTKPPRQGWLARRKEAKRDERLAAQAAKEARTAEASPPTEPPADPPASIATGPTDEPEGPAEAPEEPSRERPLHTYGTFALFAGPALHSRFANIQAIDANGVPLQGFEPTLFRAPFYTGPALRAELAPLREKTGEPILLFEGGFSRSVGLNSNLNGEQISTVAQELFGFASLRIGLEKAGIVVRGGFSQYRFEFAPNQAQIEAGVQDQLFGLGLSNLSYVIINTGLELHAPLGKSTRLLFMGASYDALLSAGQDALASYGLTQNALGGHARVGGRMRLGGLFVAELSAFARVFQVEYEGGGSLLEGERSVTTDTLLGGGLSIGYATH